MWDLTPFIIENRKKYHKEICVAARINSVRNKERDFNIMAEFCNGSGLCDLSVKYKLSVGYIKRIANEAARTAFYLANKKGGQ